MKIYVFAMNHNPLTNEDEQFLTEIKIPAETDNEAITKLAELIGRKLVKKCFINDKYEYN